jgi:hypothetical protein
MDVYDGIIKLNNALMTYGSKLKHIVYPKQKRKLIVLKLGALRTLLSIRG